MNLGVNLRRWKAGSLYSLRVYIFGRSRIVARLENCVPPAAKLAFNQFHMPGEVRLEFVVHKEAIVNLERVAVNYCFVQSLFVCACIYNHEIYLSSLRVYVCNEVSV